MMMREENLAQRVQYEMARRGWSQERMAKEMTDAGYPMYQGTISKITRPRGKRRTISADEAIGFAKVFGISLEECLLPFDGVQQIKSEIAALTQDRNDIDRRINDLTEQLEAILREQEARAA